MGISLWKRCARNVRIALFHAQESARPIRAAAWRNAAFWRSFSRSVGVPAETFATPRRASQALRPDGEAGGATVGARGASPARPVGGPEPGANRREAVRSPSAGRREAPGGRGDAPDGTASLCAEAGASGPIFPRSQGADGTAPRTDPRGCVRAPSGIAARASSWRPQQRGSRGGAKRSGRRQNGSIRGKAGLAKGRAGTDGGKLSSPESGPRRRCEARLSLGKRVAKRRNVRRLLRIGSQAGSRGVRRCLAGHARGSLSGEPGNLTPPFFTGRRIGDQPLFAAPALPPRPFARRVLPPGGAVVRCGCAFPGPAIRSEARVTQGAGRRREQAAPHREPASVWMSRR